MADSMLESRIVVVMVPVTKGDYIMGRSMGRRVNSHVRSCTFDEVHNTSCISSSHALFEGHMGVDCARGGGIHFNSPDVYLFP